MRNLLACAAIACALVLVGASPAAARGGGGSDATNFESRVTANPHPGDLRWTVIAGDSLLELDNRSGREVIVEGYAGEPYLRFDEDGGVYENRRSPATYLNQDRYARTEVPADVDADAEPVWREVRGGSTYAWHDHRIHWMSQDKPPAGGGQPGRDRGGAALGRPLPRRRGRRRAGGVLRYVPPDPWWPWVLGGDRPGLAAGGGRGDGEATEPVEAPGGPSGRRVAGRHGRGRRRAPMRPPRGRAGHHEPERRRRVTGAVFLVAAVAAAWVAWRARRPAFALLFGGLALLLCFGVSHTGALGASQLATVLPDEFTRAVVAANIVLVVPMAILVLAGEGRLPSQPGPGGATPPEDD